MRKRFIYLYCLLTVSIVGCGTVAITGRSQLDLVSDSDLRKAANTNFNEIITAANKKGAILTGTESTKSKDMVKTVTRASEKIIAAADLKTKYNWEIVVIKADAPNAFAMPNGKIVVFSGLFDVAKTEAQVAAVIGHEVAHISAKHSAERVSQAILIEAVANTAAVALAINNNKNAPLIGAALGFGAHFGILLPFSREHESESDRIGQIYMARAGYDPVEAIAVWENMEARSGKYKFEYLSTHPSSKTRIEQLKKWLPEAQVYYSNNLLPLPSNITQLELAKKATTERIALAPVAPTPDLQEDYWYRTSKENGTSETNNKYTKAPCEFGTCVEISSTSIKSGKHINTTVVTKDFWIKEIVNPDGTRIKFDPPFRRINFPLKSGDSWGGQTEVQTKEGKRISIPIKGQILDYSSITVPAGTFMAFKIVSSAGGRKWAEEWYAPEIQQFVKSTAYKANGGEDTYVLTDFRGAHGSF